MTGSEVDARTKEGFNVAESQTIGEEGGEQAPDMKRKGVPTNTVQKGGGEKEPEVMENAENLMTRAERRFMEIRQRRETDRFRKQAATSYRQNVEVYLLVSFRPIESVISLYSSITN